MISICIPVMSQIHDTKAVWGCHIANTRKSVELVVIDNGSNDNTLEFIKRFVFPHFEHHKLIVNKENIGMIATLNQAIAQSTGNIIALLHNDVYIYENNWVDRVEKEFEDKQVGLVGFHGSQILIETGAGWNSYNNFIESELHGYRTTGSKEVVTLDGLALIGRREMFNKVNGFDSNYTYHHFYDRDISISSIEAGYKNKVVGVYCHHMSGITANRSQYQEWIEKKMGTTGYKGDKASYHKSEQYFFSKWKHKLPIFIKQ